jgi:DNA-binding transcriptional LysR family regulator
MPEYSLQELLCFDAVISEGSFQAAAARLGRTHPSVHAAVGNLERRLGVSLLDRSNYRVSLSEAGQRLIGRVRRILDDAALLEQDAAQLAGGAELQLSIAIGDLCPLERIVPHLSAFFRDHPGTQLNLHYGAIAGPWQSLLDEDVQLIFHHREPEELRIETLPLFAVTLVPVVAPGFLPFAAHEATPQRMATLRQCILRDTATRWSERSYRVLPGSPRCTAPDQAMKKQLIVDGYAWGHLPRFMIEQELASGRLLAIDNPELPTYEIELCAGRAASARHGPVAQRLWASLQRWP